VVVDATVGLAAAIEALRAELSGAMLSGGGEGLLFELDPIELTVQAVVTTSGDGKVGWKILEFGASRESAVTQTLTFKLKPLWKRRDGTLVRDFAIASVDAAGDTFGQHD
jgi:Trypsin-co-occurring domain 2